MPQVANRASFRACGREVGGYFQVGFSCWEAILHLASGSLMPTQAPIKSFREIVENRCLKRLWIS